MRSIKKIKFCVMQVVQDDCIPLLFSKIEWLSSMLELWQGRLWIFPLLGLRQDHFRIEGFYETWLDRYLAYDFFAHFRMEKTTFNTLLSEVGSQLKQKSIHFGGRVMVPIEKRLLVTLWYLAKGDTIISTADRFNITQSKTWNCIQQVIKILGNLMGKYIVWPKETEYEIISEQYFERSQYPGVVGAIDGTHIECKIPLQQRASYQDRKFRHSISVQGIATITKLFIDVSVGYPGSLHDARILKESAIGRVMYSGQNNIFGEYHLVGDGAYPCKEWLMTPYRDTGRLTRLQKRHNFYLSSARVVIEHVFGLLKERWRICKYVNVNSIEKAVDIITACCVLHNFCFLNHDEFDVDVPATQERIVDIALEIDSAGIEKRSRICESFG